MHWRRKWQPTPVFLPGESQGWGAWWAAVYEVAQSDMTEATQQQQHILLELLAISSFLLLKFLVASIAFSTVDHSSFWKHYIPLNSIFPWTLHFLIICPVVPR